MIYIQKISISKCYTVPVTVPPLVVLVLLDDRPGLVVDHPREAAVSLVSLEQSSGIKTGILKQQCL